MLTGVEMTTTEPTVARRGRAYVSLLDDNLCVRVDDNPAGSRTTSPRLMFDLTRQDGRDLRAALTEVLDPPVSPSHWDAIDAVAQRLHRLAIQWGADSRSRTWDGLDESGRDYWRSEARELLAVAAAHGTW